MSKSEWMTFLLSKREQALLRLPVDFPGGYKEIFLHNKFKFLLHRRRQSFQHTYRKIFVTLELSIVLGSHLL